MFYSLCRAQRGLMGHDGVDNNGNPSTATVNIHFCNGARRPSAFHSLNITIFMLL